MSITLYLFPVFSSLIGWVTNFIAVKMLFYPRHEKNFGLFKLHGVFPKRQALLAQRLGRVVANELLSVESIQAHVHNPETMDELNETIKTETEHYLREKLATIRIPLIASIIDDKRLVQIQGVMIKEIDKFIPKIMDGLSQKISTLDVEALVAEEVRKFDALKIEKLIKGILNKELHFIELAGAVLGFIIGLVQTLLIANIQ